MEYKDCTKKDFDAIAKDLAKELKKGDILLLSGELGTGKTYFTTKLCKHLKVKNTVNSPSYVLLNEYIAPPTQLGGRGGGQSIPIYHYDLYRLTSPEEAIELGILDRLSDGITIIEWPELVRDLLPPQRIEIHITHSDSHRNMKITKNT